MQGRAEHNPLILIFILEEKFVKVIKAEKQKRKTIGALYILYICNIYPYFKTHPIPYVSSACTAPLYYHPILYISILVCISCVTTPLTAVHTCTARLVS